MYIGQFQSRLTDKFRISVPKKIRDQMGEEMIVARWYEKCMVLVSRKKWNELVKRLTGKQTVISTSIRNIDRFIYAMAYEVTVDNQGRFVVPKILLEYAEIDAEVVFVGLGDRVEIWAKENWDELERQVGKKAEKAVEEIAKQERKVVVNG